MTTGRWVGTRTGRKSRRRLEFDAIVARVRNGKQRFIDMLNRNLSFEGGHALWTGARQPDGYGHLSFRFRGQHLKIGAHRLFLILRLARPIGPDMEAGHVLGCLHRNCVRHVAEQHWKENLAQRRRDDCPF